MSPKGGIRPHKRFSVQSNRSEVLFVDLMAEHLTPGGRAAIVVPEGIIFQSGTAYKSLRKMLVDDYLVGVISLPAGVFNPYSGVKTSILWLDKSLARKTNQILFAKITADGFDLGAQRRPVKQNDLPGAFRAIQQYIEFLQIGSISADSPIDGMVRTRHGVSPHGVSPQDSNDNFVRPPHGVAQQSPESALQSIYPQITLVAKSAIAENGDYNLSGERYKIQEIRNTNYPIVEIGEIIKLSSGNGLISSNMKSGNYPVYGGNGITGWHSEYFVEEPTIVIGRVGAYCGSIHITKPCSWITDNGLYITEYLRSDVNQMFLCLMLKELNINRFAKVGGQPSISQSTVKELQIPLPPLSIQQEIVAEIEAYQKVIDGARQVVENYKPQITIDPDWKSKELQCVSNIISGYSFDSKDFSKENTVKCIKITNVGVREFIEDTDELLPEKFVETQKNFTVKEGDIVISLTRTIISSGLKVARVPLSWNNALVNQRVAAIKSNLEADLTYIYLYLSTDVVFNYIEEKSRSLMQPNLSVNDLKKLQIPLPPLETQQQIVAQIEHEQGLVNANKELIALMEQKIKDRIARVWGE